MIAAIRGRVLLALLSLTFATGALALALPPKPSAWIVDNAGLLTSAQQLALNQKCESFYRATKAELSVITFPSLEGEDPLDYTNRAVNEWKVKGDRIAVLFIFLKERQMRFQVGYGLEGDLTDAFTTEVRLNTLVPAFRAGRYYDGINQTVDQLAKKIDPKWAAPAPTGTMPDSALRGPLPDRSNDLPFAAGDVIKLVLLLLVIFFIVLPLLRRGGCTGCVGCFPFFPFGGGGWGGGGWGGGGTTFGGGGGGGWSIGSTFGGGGGSSFGGGGSGGGW
jgi:uncharacterized protein